MDESFPLIYEILEPIAGKITILFKIYYCRTPNDATTKTDCDERACFYGFSTKRPD